MQWQSITLATQVADPRYPEVWHDEVPLAILGDVEGVDPYNTATTRSIPNHRLTPAHPAADDAADIVMLILKGARS